jgi:Tfp pilus assembly protein PilF
MSYYTILALRELGQDAEADSMLQGLANHANTLPKMPTKIDYFATSLPTMLLFKEDLDRKKNTSATVMLAQAALLSRQYELARRLLAEALDSNPNHALAIDLMNGLSRSASRSC